MTKIRTYLLPLALFFSVLGAVGLTINAKTQTDFNLQQMGVESLVERHTFALEGSKTSQLQPMGDTFVFERHTYAIKQPGQFVLGAVAYSVLHAFGYTYLSSYVLTAALVTFFTSGILLAALAVALYFVVVSMTASSRAGILIAWVGTLATILLPYAGVAHHDVQATAIVFMGWTILFVESKKTKSAWLVVSGVLIGIALCISMLPIVVSLCIGMYVLCTRKWVDRVLFVIGSGIGILPVFLYNFFIFGSVFAFPNTISGTRDTNPFLSLSNSFEKIYFYLFSPAHSLWMFMPVLLFAFIGLFFFKRKFRAEAVLIWSLFVVHLLYVSSIETVGHAQYGPRYLLPVLPFVTLGLVGLFRSHPVIKAVVIFFGAISLCLSGVGALGGVMYQTIWIHPFLPYVNQLIQGEFSYYPLKLLGIGLLVTSGLLFYLVFSTSEAKVLGSSDALPTKNPSI